MADTADVGRDTAIAARVPARLDLLKELNGGVAPGIPALQEIRLIGIEDTPPIVALVLPDGPGWHLEIPLDRATAAADLRGDGHGAPALAVQGPDRVIACLPAGGALGCPRLLGWGRGGWGHRDRACPTGQRHGLLGLRRVDGVERPAMRREHVGEGFGEVLQ